MARTKQTSPTKESAGSDVQRRVIKACQRCRLKKCKCDGVTPCSRCRVDDAICAYGKARQSDRIFYRKGYVQMLERQQLQMIAGIQELYRRLRNNEAWPCFVAEDDLGPQPLTHKVLETLGILPGPWDETDYVRDALTTAPQSPFDVGFPNSLPQLPEFSPSYGADDGSTSTPKCSPSSRANNGSTSAPKFSPSYGANDGWMPTPEYTLDYGANDGWMLTPESDIVCTESLQLAHMDHILPTTDDSRPLSKRRKVDLSMQLTPPFTSFLTFSHPSNIPFNTGVM